MDEKIIDGRKTKIQKPQETNQSIIDSGDFTTHGRNSGSIEYQSERVSGKVDKGLGRTEFYRTIGGTLRLFREVMREGLDYMDSHGERLETRLTEHKYKRASYLEKAAALEKEIARLLEQAEQLPQNPDEEE